MDAEIAGIVKFLGTATLCTALLCLTSTFAWHIYKEIVGWAEMIKAVDFYTAHKRSKAEEAAREASKTKTP